MQASNLRPSCLFPLSTTHWAGGGWVLRDGCIDSKVPGGHLERDVQKASLIDGFGCQKGQSWRLRGGITGTVTMGALWREESKSATRECHYSSRGEKTEKTEKHS